MGFVTSEPNKIYVEDVQFSTSVSEAVGNKLASSLNFILDGFISLDFGVSGAPYSGLSTYPYVLSGGLENVDLNCTISEIRVFNEIAGISGTTQFRVERQLSTGGAWANVFSTNCSIAYTAGNNLAFKNTDTAPVGVTQPVISISNFLKNEKLRLVIVTAADQAQNLRVKVILRPV